MTKINFECGQITRNKFLKKNVFCRLKDSSLSVGIETLDEVSLESDKIIIFPMSDINPYALSNELKQLADDTRVGTQTLEQFFRLAKRIEITKWNDDDTGILTVEI